MLRMYTMNSNLVGSPTGSKTAEIADDIKIRELIRRLKASKLLLKATLYEKCET